MCIVLASLFKNGPTIGFADSTDHGGQGGGQGPLAQAGGAARARADLAPQCLLWTRAPLVPQLLPHCSTLHLMRT